MVKHTQTFRRQIADELFDYFGGLSLEGLNIFKKNFRQEYLTY